ncbi:MAG: SDR family oxidoreductase [Ignavibacteriales bacterium]|nr:MAG: SDR family oxidoreductase [Ignavibacteriales bacterium]
MKVLFIGGTGKISSACSQLAVEKGIELYLLNRSQTTERPAPKEAIILNGNIYDADSAKSVIGSLAFDCVVDWIAYTPKDIENDLNLFSGRTSQFIFISSASAYQKPLQKLPITENTPLVNPYWEYSRNKIACEERLMRAFREENFPVTIVRPSHTYDKTMIPLKGAYTAIDRMRKGKRIIIHGDGSSLWVLTHHKDFAKGFTGLLGNQKAVGEVFQITSDELLNWNQICNIMAEAAGTQADIIHIPSDVIAAYDKQWGEELLGDKSTSVVFDNSKIKKFVPEFEATILFAQGAEDIMNWYNADPSRQIIDEGLNHLMDKIISKFESVYP